MGLYIAKLAILIAVAMSMNYVTDTHTTQDYAKKEEASTGTTPQGGPYSPPNGPTVLEFNKTADDYYNHVGQLRPPADRDSRSPR